MVLNDRCVVDDKKCGGAVGERSQRSEGKGVSHAGVL